jgi:hypothetical protein
VVDHDHRDRAFRRLDAVFDYWKDGWMMRILK